VTISLFEKFLPISRILHDFPKRNAPNSLENFVEKCFSGFRLRLVVKKLVLKEVSFSKLNSQDAVSEVSVD
jgi:hypothetical protein